MFDDLDEKTIIDLKEVLNYRFYNDIIKCGFENELDRMANEDGLINIDTDDIVKLSKSMVIGSISEVIDDVNKDYSIKLISDIEPNECIFYIHSGTNLSLGMVDLLLDKLKNKYKKINILFGVNCNNDDKDKIEVNALLLNSNYKKKEAKVKENKIKNESSDIDNDLLYRIAESCIKNNAISINALQVEFGLGFNRCSNLVSKLEDLGIVSERNGSNPRDILIKDMNEVKKRIYEGINN